VSTRRWRPDSATTRRAARIGACAVSWTQRRAEIDEATIGPGRLLLFRRHLSAKLPTAAPMIEEAKCRRVNSGETWLEGATSARSSISGLRNREYWRAAPRYCGKGAGKSS